EAMAAGLPVLFTDRGCLKDTVGEGEAGFEVRIDDPQHLADRLLWLLDHPEEMRVMGDNARKRFEAFYTAGRFVANMTQVLTRVTGEVP
ncbi:MAG: glycosyltransferase, partial [Nitrospira sp.]|nr:glycosyltransferase [Nitrospira sp.]